MTTPNPTAPLWPSDWQGCRVQGQYLDLAGLPLSGTVTFTASPSALLDANNSQIVVPKVFTAALDSDGVVDIVLPATDDPDINPTKWTYAVSENFSGGRRYNIEAPQNSTINLVDVSPVPAGNGMPMVRGPRGEAGGIQNVNGKTGDIIVLVPSDIGADAAGAAAAVLATSLQKASNLSDLASATTARTNLGLGTAATTATTAYDAAGAAASAQTTAEAFATAADAAILAAGPMRCQGVITTATAVSGTVITNSRSILAGYSVSTADGGMISQMPVSSDPLGSVGFAMGTGTGGQWLISGQIACTVSTSDRIRLYVSVNSIVVWESSRYITSSAAGPTTVIIPEFEWTLPNNATVTLEVESDIANSGTLVLSTSQRTYIRLVKVGN